MLFNTLAYVNEKNVDKVKLPEEKIQMCI